MKIKRIRITIEPWYLQGARMELRVEAIVDGIRYTACQLIEEDDMESMFDRLMDNAGKEIKRMVKSKEKKLISDYVTTNQTP